MEQMGKPARVGIPALLNMLGGEWTKEDGSA